MQCCLTLIRFLANNLVMSRPFSAESVFRALAHRTRRRILESLRKGPRFASEIINDPDLRKPTLSDHLRVLRQCEIVKCRRRGTKLEYEINSAALRHALVWLDSV